MDSVPVFVLGASGFAAGELLRLLHNHPVLDVQGVVSASSAGERIGKLHPHLRAAYPESTATAWGDVSSLSAQADRIAVFSALPHGHSAGRLMQFIDAFPTTDVIAVDLSADYRYPTVEQFEAVYKLDHAAPDTLSTFFCGIPELSDHGNYVRIAHPGCFTTAVTLAAAPLSAAGYFDAIRVSAVTGSTGSGREPKPTTHHPVRANNMYAYKPLHHRHAPEMEMLSTRTSGRSLEVSFVPHSGPFARGIHATLFAENKTGASTNELLDSLSAFYVDAPFVHVSDTPPRIKDVVGTNNCHLSAFADEDTIVLFSVIDNLIKGASGGGLQWMNRLLGIDEKSGLDHPGLGWI